MISYLAPAKINLALHVTGQRADGYHLLDSLVIFADIGDQVEVFDADTLSLTIKGPEADGVPSDISNSILKAATLFKPQDRGAGFLLTKNLPTASGIGGGSADAAAAIRGLMEHWDGATGGLFESGLNAEQLTEDAKNRIIAHVLPLGADVPVCLFSRAARMRGIGDQLEFCPHIPALHAVLVNPRVPVATPRIFQALPTKQNAPLSALPDAGTQMPEFLEWLRAQRNDLQPAAEALVPEISTVLKAITTTPQCLLARMSGSGATCFGLYGSAETAAEAARDLANDHPDWWVRQTLLR